jgi:hypothetical protein
VTGDLTYAGSIGSDTENLTGSANHRAAVIAARFVHQLLLLFAHRVVSGRTYVLPIM